MWENFGNSGGEGGLILGADVGQSRGEEGSYGKSLPWGWYGYFLEPHRPGGGGALPYMGYVGMCRCEGYGFQAVYSRIGYINQSVWV